MKLLAVCHTVIIQSKRGQMFYNASSPDELALVNAAKYFGVVFKGRDDANFVEIDMFGKTIKYELLNVIEFTSSRKRMSVIVKTEEEKIIVMTKGADSIIYPRLTK